MKTADQIPYYSADGNSRGFRTLEAAQKLIAANLVNPSYGRKGHLKAIWAPKTDGTSAVATNASSGTRYSVLENLEHGRCWKLKRLDRRDEDGVPFTTRGVFTQVVADCLVA
jgi:hypothetical protein